MRRTHAKVHRPYKVPLILPIFTLMVSIFLVVTPIISDPDIKYLSAIGFILSGVAVYIPFVYLKKRPQIMNKYEESLINKKFDSNFRLFFSKTHSFDPAFLYGSTNKRQRALEVSNDYKILRISSEIRVSY